MGGSGLESKLSWDDSPTTTLIATRLLRLLILLSARFDVFGAYVVLSLAGVHKIMGVQSRRMTPPSLGFALNVSAKRIPARVDAAALNGG